MAATRAEALASIVQLNELLDEIDLFLNSNSENLQALLIATQDSLKGEYVQDQMKELDRIRKGIVDSVSPQALRRAYEPFLRDFVDAIGKTPGGFAKDIVAFRDDLRTQGTPDTLNSREMTFGSVSAGGSNTGNGTVLRVTVDEEGEDLEGATDETKTFTCVIDGALNSQTLHKEVFELDGEGRGKDSISPDGGSGISKQRVVAVDASDSASQILNPSFETYNGGAAAVGTPGTPTAVTDFVGWTMNATSSWRSDIDRSYRGINGQSPSTTFQSIRCIANGTLTQQLNIARAPTLNKDVPYLVQVALYVGASISGGTFRIDFGAVNQTWTLTALSAGWNVIRLDLDEDLYFANFNEANIDLVFTVASLAGDTINIDDVLVIPFETIDSVPYLIVGGSTVSKVGDNYSFTDTQNSTRGINMYWMAHRTQVSQLLGYPFTFKSKSDGSETISDP